LNTRAAAIVLWLGTLALCGAQIARTPFVADLSSFLPAHPTQEQRLLVEQLRHGTLSRVMMIGIDGADAAHRAAISRALAASLADDDRFAGVANGATGGFERERGLLFDHRYTLSPAVDADRFSVEGLRSAIGATLDLLRSSAGLMVKSLLTRDPTGETLALMDTLRPARSPHLEAGVWSSADGHRAVLLARTRASGADIDAQGEALAAVQDAFTQARAAAGAPAAGASLVVTGPGVFSVRARQMIEHDVVRLTTLSAGLVMLLLLAVYRSPRLLALGFVPVISGAVVGIAAVSAGFGTVHGITLGFGTTLIGEAVDYSIYLFVQSEGSGLRGGDWVARFWPTIRLGVLTSIAGFCALPASGLPGLAQLGVYSIAGLVAAAAVTRYVLPSLAPAHLRVRDLSAVGERIGALAVGQRALRVIAIVAMLTALGALAAHHATLWDRDLASLNPITAADRENDRELRQALGASDARVMVAVSAPGEQAALEAAERTQAALDPLVSRGAIAGYDSPARILPSEAMQRARALSLPDAATLRARLPRALAGMPLRASRLRPFVADVERARTTPPVTASDLEGTALALALDGLLMRAPDGTWTAMIGLHPPSGHALDAQSVRQALAQAKVPGALVLDVKSQLDALYGGYFRRALLASAAGLAVIVALLLASLRSLRRLARVIAPFAGGVVIAAGFHAYAGTALTLFHLVGLLLVAAIGSNYSLFFDRLAHRPEASAPRTIASLVLANATTVIGFGILALSSIPVLHAIGSTVAVGAFATLVIAAAFTPPRALHAEPAQGSAP
jgi:predicted exporter